VALLLKERPATEAEISELKRCMRVVGAYSDRELEITAGG